MERWRSYFGKANADIWTVIEQAINVAAMDHPKDFKEKRSEIAETLFARNLVQMHSEIVGLSGSVGGVADDDQPSLMEEGEVRDDEEERTMAVAPSDGGSHRLRGSYDEEEALTYEADQESILLQELDRIKQIIEENDQPENVLLGTLQKLEDMQITVNALKVTEIGKQVNSLRKHSSKHVRAIVKRLVKHWKFLVDQWVKVAGDVPAAATAVDALAVSECRDIPEAGNRLWGSHSSPVNDALPLMTARTPSVELSELFSFIDDEMCGHAKNKEELEPSIKDSMYHSSRSQSGSVLTDSSDCDAKLSTNQTWGLRTPGEMGSATRDNHTSERMEKGPESVLRGSTYQCYTDHKELNHLSGLPVSKALAKNSGSASRPLSDMSKVRVASGPAITVRCQTRLQLIRSLRLQRGSCIRGISKLKMQRSNVLCKFWTSQTFLRLSMCAGRQIYLSKVKLALMVATGVKTGGMDNEVLTSGSRLLSDSVPPLTVENLVQWKLQSIVTYAIEPFSALLSRPTL